MYPMIKGRSFKNKPRTRKNDNNKCWTFLDMFPVMPYQSVNKLAETQSHSQGLSSSRFPGAREGGNRDSGNEVCGNGS